jgi:dTDP-glucose pyrophosphorylase
MWGIIPAAGIGSRIQPLAFSKELLPVGSRFDGATERPRAVSEYLVERMILAGATRLCFVVSPGKSDILEYYGGQVGPAHVSYTVQAQPAGLCDALFQALPLVRKNDQVLIGLPDTVWFPSNALQALPAGMLAFLLFPVARPELFDSVVTDQRGRVLDIQVKRPDAESRWIWGAFKLPGHVFATLHRLWLERGRRDEYIGTLVNAYIAAGGEATGVRAGQAYVDVGTLHGYREAMQLLDMSAREDRPVTIVPHREVSVRRPGDPRLEANDAR